MAQSCPTTNTTIADVEFANFSGLCPTEVNILCSLVTSIGDYAFWDCSSLESVEFPAVITIGAGAFGDCTNLKSAIFISATSIGTNAFENCGSLENVACPLVKTIEYEAFQHCSSLENVSFLSVETIGQQVFEGCTNLKSAILPSAKTIGTYAFLNCSNLKTAVFPSATTIDRDAFVDCGSLESVNFPSATSIGNRTFQNCYSLKSITLGSNPPTIATTNVFSGVPPTCIVYVPYNTTVANFGEYQSRLTNAGFQGTLERLPTPTHTLTITAPVNGSVEVDGTPYTTVLTFDEGDNVVVESFPNVCYQFAKWTNSNGDSISNASSLNISITSDTTLTANFTLNQYDLTVSSANTSQGSVTGTETNICGGTTKTITATPNACYQFAKWTNSNGDSISNVSSLNISIISDTILTANFALTKHSLSVISGSNGSAIIGTSVTTTSESGITCGSSRTITATPDPCYQFANWTNGSGVVSTNATLNVVVDSDTTFIANFQPIPTVLSLNISSNNATMGNVSSSNTAPTCGNSVTLTATPEPKHRFIGWYENNILVSNSSSYTFTISGNRTLVGHFEKKPSVRIKKINVKKGRVRIKPQP